MAGRIAGITIEIGGDTSKLTSALKKVDGSLKKTKTGLKDIERLLKFNPGNTTLLEQKQRNLASAITKTKERLDVLREAEAQMAGRDLTEDEQRQFEELQREIIATENQLKQLEKQMSDFGSVGAQKIAAAGKKMEAFGDKLQNAGAKITSAGQALMPLTGVIVGVGTAAVKKAADFEDAMAGVQATLGVTSDATITLNGETVNVMASLENLAREMGKETKFSAKEAADAINILAMAGYDTQQVYDSLPKLLSLAAAGDLDIAAAADITTGILAGFNMTTEESGGVVDKLAKLASSAKGTVESFGEGMSTVAGQALTTGQSFDDVATALGVLGNNNLSASQGGKMLQRVLKNLYQPTAAAAKELDALGVSAYDADGKARALPDVLSDMQAALAGMNDEAKNTSMSKIFDAQSIRGASALIRSAGEEFAGLKGKIEDSTDAAKQMADVRMETLSGQLQILKSQTEEAGIAFGKALLPVITDLVKDAQKAVDWINKLDDGQKRTIIRLAAVAAAAGPVLMVVGKLTSGAGKVISAGGKLLQLAPKLSGAAKTVTKGITGMNGSVLSSVAGFAAAHPAILLVVGALTTLTAAMIALKKHHDNFIQKTWGLTEAEKEANQAILDSAAAYREAEAARKETIRGIGEEYGYYERLAAELLSITDSDGRVLESKKARADFIVGTLNDALGLEIEMIDGVIQANESLQSSIDNTIQKKKAEAYLDADQDSYKEAIQNQYSAQMKYISATNKRVDAEKELAVAQQQYSDILAEQASSSIPLMYAGQVATAKDAVEAASAALHGFEIAETQAQQEWLGFVNTIENHAALEEAIKSGEGLDIAMQNLANGFVTAENATHSMLNQQLTDFTLKYEQMKVAAEQGSSAVTETELSAMAALVERARAEYYKGGVDSGMALAEGMNAGIPAVEQSNAALDAAATPPQTNTGKWGEAGNAPPQAYAAGMQGGAGEVQGAASAVEQAATPPAGNTAAWNAAGAANPQAFAAGMQGGAGAAQGAGAQVSQASVTGAKSAAPQMQAAGQSLGNTNAAGLTATIGMNNAAGVNIASAARSGAGTVSLYSTGYSTGSSYGTGLVAGLQSQLAAVRSAASALSSAAARASASTLQVNSPSKLAISYGRYYGEGLVIGMNEMQRDVWKAGSRLAGMVAAGAPAAMVDYPNQQAEIAARSITVTAQAAPTDGGVSQMLGAILTRLNNLDVVIRNAGQFADGVTNYANRRLGRISTLQESGVI